MGRVASGWGGESLGEGLLPLTLVTATRRVDTSRNEVSTSAACAPAGGRMRYCTCSRETKEARRRRTSVYVQVHGHTFRCTLFFVLYSKRKRKLYSQKLAILRYTIQRRTEVTFLIVVFRRVYFASTSVELTATKKNSKKVTTRFLPPCRSNARNETQRLGRCARYTKAQIMIQASPTLV